MKKNLIIVEGVTDKKFIEALLLEINTKIFSVKEVFGKKDENYQKDILFFESLLSDLSLKKSNDLDIEIKKLESLLAKFLKNFKVEKITNRGGKNEFSVVAIKTLLNKFVEEDPNKKSPDNVLLICDADFVESNETLSGFAKTESFLQKMIEDLKKDESFLSRYKNVKFSFFILPNHKDDGNLDSLFLDCAASEIIGKIECVDRYLHDCLEQKPAINKLDKLRSQLLISGFKHKITDIGDVFGKNGYWNLNIKKDDPLLALKEFLKKFK